MKHLRNIAITLLAATSTMASAVVVDNTAGNLSNLVTDVETTQLTITGTIDARDFAFIHDELAALETLDMSGAQIVAYDAGRAATEWSNAADELPAYALAAKPLRQVTLPAALTIVGEGAFAGCRQLTAIEFPATIATIGDFAFSATGLTAVTVPAGVTSMGKEVFAHCPSLATAVVNSLIVGDAAFLDDAALATVTLGSGVTRVGQKAFAGTGLTLLDATAATQLATVNDWAFTGAALSSIALPASVTTVGRGALFGATELTSATLPQALDEVPDYAFVATKVDMAHVVPAEATAIGNYAFYNLDQAVDTVFLPASLSHIGDRAFAGTLGIKNYAVPTASVPTLGELVWEGVNQPVVNVKTASNELSDAFAQADQWKEFHILRLYLLGDVNNDGNINVADITAIRSYMLGNNPRVFIFEAADINNDGNITANDISRLRNKILNEDTDTHVYRVRGADTPYGIATEDALEMDNVLFDATGTARVALRLKDSRPYTALQFDLTLPNGVVLDDELTTVGERAPQHGVYSMMHNNGTARVMLYSNNIDNLLEGDEPVVYLSLRATDDVESGATIGIDELLLVTDEIESYVGHPSMATIADPTGVNDITTSDFHIFATQGKLIIDAPEAATAQLVSMNGAWIEAELQPGRNEVPLATGIYAVNVGNKSAKVAIR